MSSIGPVELHLVAVDEQIAAGEALLLLGGVAELDDLRLGAAREAHAFDDLFGKERGDARVERLAQVGQPHRVARYRMKQAGGALQHRRQVAQSLDLHAGEGVDHGQEVGRVGKDDRLVGAELGYGGLDLGARLVDNGARPADGARRDSA